jgi:hypothetical protein
MRIEKVNEERGAGGSELAKGRGGKSEWIFIHPSVPEHLGVSLSENGDTAT